MGKENPEGRGGQEGIGDGARDRRGVGGDGDCMGGVGGRGGWVLCEYAWGGVDYEVKDVDTNSDVNATEVLPIFAT